MSPYHDTTEDRIMDHGRRSSSSDLDLDELHSNDEDLTDDEETGLTHSERKHRRRRKQQHTLLDERIASTPHRQPPKPEDAIVTSSLLRTTLLNGLLIALWYTFSITISVYNKWMFSKDNLDFHFPLFTTSIHMIVQFALASLILYLMPQFRPRRLEAEYQALEGSGTSTKPPTKQPLMTKTFYLTRITPCGASTALDIGLGNFSLRFISLTFYTMCKSSVLAFVLVFAFIFRLETPTWKLCAIILVMTAGVVMMVAGETAFNALGFFLVMSASFCSGFRWSVTQILLLRHPATSNPFSTLFFVTPTMFIVLVVLALPIEGPVAIIAGFRSLAEAKGVILGMLIMLFPGCLAFCMVAAEFTLLKRTSVVTLSVCGIFKEVLTISAASLVFGDELSPINVSGLCVTIASIAAYNYLKYSKLARDARREVHEVVVEQRDGLPLRVSNEHAHTDGVDERRERMDELMRDSLSLTADDDYGGRQQINGKSSPQKRPGDVE